MGELAIPINTAFRVNGASLVCPQFIETGFYKGATAVCAHYFGFGRVASAELNGDLYRLGLELPLVAAGEIRLYHGSSPDVLPTMIDPTLKSLVYLDAHFMGKEHGAADPKYGECPLLEELRVVFEQPWAELPTVVIDDAHMFVRPWSEDLRVRFTEDQWPSTDRVKALFPGGYRFVSERYVMYCLPPA